MSNLKDKLNKKERNLLNDSDFTINNPSTAAETWSGGWVDKRAQRSLEPSKIKNISQIVFSQANLNMLKNLFLNWKCVIVIKDKIRKYVSLRNGYFKITI